MLWVQTMNANDIAKLTYIALKCYPEAMRDDLMRSTFLGEESKLLLENWIWFGSDDLSFRRNVIYDIFRRVYNGEEGCHVVDKSGREWRLSRSNISGTTAIRFENEDNNFQISDCYGLHPDAHVRTSEFTSTARHAGMAQSKYQAWLAVITSRALNDDELSRLLDDISQTTRNVKRKIIKHIATGEIDSAVLIPDVEDYYLDLIGDAEGSIDISEFASKVTKRKFDEIINFERIDGLTSMLQLASHSTLVDKIDLGSLELNELEDTYAWLSENGDVISKVGAVELAIAYAKCSPKMAASAIKMIDALRNDDSTKHGFLTQFCDLVLLVGGELTRNALFVSSAPYWRRLAVFSHAAVLQQAVVATKTDTTHLSASQCENRTPLFLIQSAIDLREEPRWQAGHLGPEYLKADFLGRILMAAEKHSNSLHEQLKAYILDDPKFKSEVHFPLAFLPGPIEGGVAPVMTLPDELVEAIESALSTSPLELSSFIPLVNSALVFKLNDRQIELASSAIRTAKYQLRSSSNNEDIEPILMGLATVAAVTRGMSLADEIIILMRVLRHRPGQSLNIDQTLYIGLIAAASRADERGWIDFVGKIFEEICFQELTQIEARSILFVLLQLCRLKPELWRSTGRAHAALESILPY